MGELSVVKTDEQALDLIDLGLVISMNDVSDVRQLAESIPQDTPSRLLVKL